jgi:hypothetical protein
VGKFQLVRSILSLAKARTIEFDNALPILFITGLVATDSVKMNWGMATTI